MLCDRQSFGLSAVIDLAHVSFCGVQPKPALSHPSRPRAFHRRASVRRPLSVTAQHPLATWLLSQAGLDPAAYRTDFATRRIPACLRQLRTASPALAQEKISRHPALLGVALNSILIGVTGFFRDAALFERLRAEVLPSLLARHARVRVYGAGVSTGEELYSLAILFDELEALDRVDILGVDCRPHAVAQAMAGTYATEALTAVSDRRREACFLEGDGWAVVAPRLRRVVWRQADLMRFEDPVRRHLIFCRNVAIYLSPEAATKVWTRLCLQLEPDGYLVTGRGEQPPASLPLKRLGLSLYRRV